MTAFRLISLPAHGAVELALGLVLMVAPFALGLGAAGTLVSAAVGALVVGLALSAAVADTGTIDIAAHYAFDIGIAFGLIGGGLVLGLAGDGQAALLLLSAALVQLGLNFTTRYSARS